MSDGRSQAGLADDGRPAGSEVKAGLLSAPGNALLQPSTAAATQPGCARAPRAGPRAAESAGGPPACPQPRATQSGEGNGMLGAGCPRVEALREIGAPKTFSLIYAPPFKGGVPLKALSAEQKRYFEGEHKSSLGKEIALFHLRTSLPLRGEGWARGT